MDPAKQCSDEQIEPSRICKIVDNLTGNTFSNEIDRLNQLINENYVHQNEMQRNYISRTVLECNYIPVCVHNAEMQKLRDEIEAIEKNHEREKCKLICQIKQQEKKCMFIFFLCIFFFINPRIKNNKKNNKKNYKLINLFIQ
jgi:hypothetical protein